MKLLQVAGLAKKVDERSERVITEVGIHKA
jgi:hypothetical protein